MNAKSRLERNSQPQTRGTAAVYTFLRERGESASEIGVRVYVESCWIGRIRLKLWSQRIGIYLDVKPSQIRKTAVTKILIRHADWMVEDVIEVRAQRRCQAFANLELLVKPEIHAPSSRAP